MKRLSEFFPESAIGWLPGATTQDKKKALAMPYISARDVMDRLDAAAGLENWRDDYDVIHEGQVKCRLSVKIDGEWITKVDFGGSNDGDNAGWGDNKDVIDRSKQLKASCSDALKRAAIKFGIGRYLYSVPDNWFPLKNGKYFFDSGADAPRMPKAFLPSIEALKREQEGARQKQVDQAGSKEPDAPPKPAEKPPADPKLPKDGKALKKRLEDAEKKHKGLFQFVANCGQMRAFPIDPTKWDAEQIGMSVLFANEFVKRKTEKTPKITDEQDARLRKLAGPGDEGAKTLLAACKACNVWAGDYMTEAEAQRVVELLEKQG